MYDIWSSNSASAIFYGNNRINIFGNFKLPIWIFQNKFKSWFLINLHHSLENYGAWKDEEPIGCKTEILLPKKYKISFFLAIYNFNQQFYWKIYARRWIDPKGSFVYSLVFSDKKNQIPKILPMWVFVPLKFWDFAAGRFWYKCLRCTIFIKAIVFHPYFIELTTFISIWL